MSCPDCHEPAKFQGYRTKTLIGLTGPIELRRPYYHCSHCHTGHYPGDDALGQEHATLTAGAERIVTLVGAIDGFARAAELVLPEVAGLRLSESTIERTTEAAGERLGDLLGEGHTRGPIGVKAAWDWNRDALGERIAYISIDATGIGIQGPGGVRAEGRMAYVGMIYDPQAFDPLAPTEARPIERARYLAGFYDLDGLGAELRRQGGQVGMDLADRWIGLSDGGHGLDEFFRVHFPRAELILDFYHASEHLADLARAWGGDGAAIAGRLESWCHTMKREGGAAVLAVLEGLDRSGLDAGTLEPYRLVTGYLRRNAYRMDYPTYLSRGWQIGSGSMESGCKSVVCQRLCGTGMRWGSDGADALCHLRALLRSEPGQWEAFWNRSIN
jgi:hypothetical protein